MTYDPQRGEYLVFWATTIPGRHSDVSSSEQEKGLNHRKYCTPTKDFESFSPTEMFFNPDFSVIDAIIFQKGNPKGARHGSVFKVTQEVLQRLGI
jgi:beta-galactosidase